MAETILSSASLALLGFFTGILFLGQTRESLTDAYTQSLEVQAQIIAEALGESAGDDTDTGDIINDIDDFISKNDAHASYRSDTS